MLRPRVVCSGSAMCQVRAIMRRAFPLATTASASDQLKGIGKCLGTFEPKNLDGKADLTDKISFEDMRYSDMRSLRRKIIRNINQRYPSVSLEMPMYGSLFREDIQITPSPSPQVDQFLDDQFSRYSSSVMKIPPNVSFDKDYILQQKKHLRKRFIYPISLAMKDRDVFLTAHTSELDRLKKVAEDLVKSDVVVKVFTDLDVETYLTVEMYSQYLVPENLENISYPVEFDGSDIIVKGVKERVSIISSRIQQIIRYLADPVKGSVSVPKTLRALLQRDWQELRFSEKFPSVTVLPFGVIDTEILISADSLDHLEQFKDWFQDSCLSEFQTENRVLDENQTVVAERLLRSRLKSGTASLSMNSDNSSHLEFTIPKKENLNLSAIDTASTCSFAYPVYAQYFKVYCQSILPTSPRLSNVNSIVQNNGVILYGGTKEERKIETEKIGKIIAGLNVIDIPFPHPVLKSKVLGEGGILVRDRYEGVCSFVPDDSSKITIVFEEGNKKNAHRFADDLRQKIGQLDFFEYSKSKSTSTLFRLDEPKFKRYASENNITTQKVHSCYRDMDSWLLYGPKEALKNYKNMLEKREQEVFEGKIVEPIEVEDYSTWHSFILYAREINNANGTVRCLYDDKIKEPGRFRVVGPAKEVNSVSKDLIELKQKSLAESESETPKLITEIGGLGLDDIPIATSIQFRFPNTEIRADREKKVLVLSSKSSASLILAEEYIRNYFQRDSKEIIFDISDKDWVFLKRNWNDVISDPVRRICQKYGVRYQRNLQQRSFTLYGLQSNTARAKESLNTYFLKQHQIYDFLKSSNEEFVETVEVEKAKVGSIFDPDLGAFRLINSNVEIQSLLGKMGSGRSYLRLKSSSNAFLNNAVSSLRQLEADIRLTHYQIDQSKLDFVKIIERASKNYDWLFPKRSKKVNVRLDGNDAQFQIGYLSDDCLEQAKMLLDGHLESLELLKEIDLPTKKLGDKMDDINDIARIVEMNEPGSIKVLISGTEDKIIVFGKRDVVQWTHDEIYNILRSRKQWEVFHIILDQSCDVKTAIKIRTQILRMFPYLMVEFIDDSVEVNSGLVLKITTLAKKMIQYPATKPQLKELIREVMAQERPP